jgi:hypothetical protein
MTTEPGRPHARTHRRNRASKRMLRFLSWVVGTATFLSPWVILGISPRPAVGAQTVQPSVIVRHRVVRRVVWLKSRARAKPSIRYVYVSGGGSGVGGSAPTVSTGGSAP